jgi:ABC-type multidrug transport system fused ATPase/permease subunit
MISKIFIEFFKKHIVITILYLITMVHIPLNSIAMPHFYGKLIPSLNKKPFDNAIKILVILIVLWGFIQGIKIASGLIHAKVFPKFMGFVRTQIINKIISHYKNNYQDLEIGDTITKIIKAPWLFEDIFDSGEDFIFRNIILVFSSFLYLFLYNKNLGLLYLMCVGVICFSCVKYITSCHPFIKKKEIEYDVMHEEIEDTLSNLLSVYTAQKIDYETNRITDFGKKLYETEQHLEKCNNKHRAIFAVICIVTYIVLNFYSIHIYRNNKIKLNILIAIIIINYSLLNSLMSVYYYARRLTDIKGRTEVFEAYLNGLPHTSKDNKFKLTKLKNINIDFKDVGFSYDKNKPIINKLNLSLTTNTIVALIGPIGSGKSTIGKLLVRLKEPDNGEIIMNNVNTKNLNIDNLREIVNYIPQHPKLFNRTLFSNITYGIKTDVAEEDIYKIIDDLDVNNVNDKFKSNMYKSVGKNGSKLSGGQRQLVWLLRAILKDSKVLILDEPTSSLDPDSKKQFIKFLKNYTKNKLVIIITHDLSILDHVNKVVKLKNGSVESIENTFNKSKAKNTF